jgi:hypothetical protein
MKKINLLSLIGSQTPRFYAISYGAAIPIFAFVYWYFFPASFYAPYAKLEQVVTGDLQRILTTINSAMHRDYEPYDIVADRWRLSTFDLANPTSADGYRLSFLIVAWLVDSTKTPERPDSIDGLRYITIPASIVEDDKLFVHGWGRTPPSQRNDDRRNVQFVLRNIKIDTSGDADELRAIKKNIFLGLTLPCGKGERS